MTSSALGRRPSGAHRRSIKSAPPVLLASLPNPMAQLSFEGSRHMVPERLPSARRERMVGIRVIDLGLETKENILAASSTLKRLDLSNLRLSEIPHEFFEELPHLEILNISRNDLTEDSFPSSMKHLESLLEIDAYSNKLTCFPKSLRKLRKLSRLKLAKNSIKTVDGLEKMKRLTLLVLDDNEIEMLSRDFYTHLRKLEVLHLTRNVLRELSGDIKTMRNLKELDVSDNALTVLPIEVFGLPHLDFLNASNNRISRLPTDVLKGKHNNRLSAIDLSGNTLVKFPEHLLHLTHSLDLSRNKIKMISGKTLKKMDWRTEQVLILDENPLYSPPLEVCECGIRAIIQYFQESKAEMKVYQGVRVLVVGGYRSGKTSMVQTLVDLQGRLMEDEDRTHGLNMYEAGIDLQGEGVDAKSLQLTIWDFSGDRHYCAWNYPFLIAPSVTLLTFSLQEYRTELFPTLLGHWLDWMLAKNNRLVLIVVATHADKVKANRITEICKEVEEKISKHIEAHRVNIEKQFQAVELKYMKLRVQTHVYPSVIPFSSASGHGLEELQAAIIDVTNNDKFFPHVMRTIPSLWAEVETYLDSMGFTMPVPVMKYDDMVLEISKRFGLKHLVADIAEYLHDTGRILWYSDHPTLQNWVVLRPSWLMDLSHSLIRHDAVNIDPSQHEDMMKFLSLTPQRLDCMIKEYREEGIIGRELLRLIWSPFFPSEFNREQVLTSVRFLAEHFEIGYIIDKPSKDSLLTVLSRFKAEKTLDDDKAENVGENIIPTKFGRLLVPLIRECKQPRAFRQEYERFIKHGALVANIRFPSHLPVGLFETLCVRAATRYNLDTLYQWNGGLYARQVKDLRCRFYLLRIRHSDGSTCVRMELRNEHGDTDFDIEHMWPLLLSFLNDTDALIASFVGTRVERNMECPRCHALSFVGEWTAPPADLQNMASKPCRVCHRDISTAFLVQPREKKRVEERLRQRLQANSERGSSPAPSLTMSPTVEDGTIKTVVVTDTDSKAMPKKDLTNTDTGKGGSTDGLNTEVADATTGVADNSSINTDAANKDAENVNTRANDFNVRDKDTDNTVADTESAVNTVSYWQNDEDDTCDHVHV